MASSTTAQARRKRLERAQKLVQQAAGELKTGDTAPEVQFKLGEVWGRIQKTISGLELKRRG